MYVNFSYEIDMTVLSILTYLPTLLLNMLLALITSRRWYDKIDDAVILGALPFPYLTAKLLNTENVKAVVSMNEDYELWLANGRKEWKHLGVEFLQLPIADIFQIPDLETLKKGVEFINHFISKNGVSTMQPRPTVYVHCKAGRTRSATLVGCYLIQKYGWSPEQAVEHIKKKRPHIWLIKKQWEALKMFYQHLIENNQIK